ncbi:MAG TPA: nitroreductase family deazaflavin-dependent oxidoreductase [Solirubrobacterales bacterium]|jgi:deazaflavin-dependent oxidoreductase (nitroreductase family)|nr:nitroreductase family deazaflavin-dependent oxidoreductase [Solirubrobacterales bacterium]
MGVHTFLYRGTGGRLGHKIPGLRGRMLLLEHVGAKSGIQRTSPLQYVEDGANVVVIASKGGFHKHPAWFHNLMANPDTEIQIGAEHRAVHAREAKPEERERLWQKAVAIYRPYEDYRARAEREIPLVVLEPR